jgi:iron complex transport system permease protein
VTAWSVGLGGLLVAVAVASATVGPVAVPADAVVKAALNALALPASLSLAVEPVRVAGASLPWPAVSIAYVHPFSFSVAETHRVIVTGIRLPRIALGALVGVALASAGTVMQGFFRNPMADPSIVGVSSGAATGAVAVIAFPLAVPFGLQTAAFVGGLAAAGAVYAIATENGRTPVATLLLAGVALQTFLGAVVSYMLLHAGEGLERAVYWLMGHLHTSSWGKVGAALPVVLVGVVLLAAYARDLNVLLLGEADAHTLGIEVERTKRLLLVVSTLVTAAAVAVSGVIGFVGLVVPHVMRLIVGPDHRILLPTSALAGGAFLVAADTLARAGPAQVPVGIVTAAVGAPFFLYLLRRREGYAL